MYKNMVDNNWKEKGFVDEPLPQGMDLENEIRLMCIRKESKILTNKLDMLHRFYLTF